MNISYEHYKTFYYVAKYKNLTMAAQELNNNQPNISRTIKLLEQELGCKLITRKSRGIDLTPEGNNLFFYVQNAVKQLQAAEDEISALSDLKQGTITIGVSVTAAYMVLLPALNAFKKLYPNIKIKLMSHNSSTAIDLVKQGLVDFAITSMFNEVAEPLTSTTILSYSDILVGGPSFKGTNKPLTLKEVSQMPIVCLTPNSSTHQFYKHLFDQKKLPFNPMYEVETTDQLCPMLIYDMGVAFIPSIYVQNSLRQGNVFELSLTETLPSRNICLIENRNRYGNIAAQKLKEFCMTPREFVTF